MKSTWKNILRHLVIFYGFLPFSFTVPRSRFYVLFVMLIIFILFGLQRHPLYAVSTVYFPSPLLNKPM
jgi:hypothetical protein